MTQSVEAVGTAGYCDVLGGGCPGRVWNGVLNGAGGLCTELPGLVSRGIVSWSEAAAQENYGADPMGKILSRWNMTFDKVKMDFCDRPAF